MSDNELTEMALQALASEGQAAENFDAAQALYERLTAILDWCDLVSENPERWAGMGVKLLQGPTFDAAREAIAQYAAYAPKDTTNDQG